MIMRKVKGSRFYENAITPEQAIKLLAQEEQTIQTQIDMTDSQRENRLVAIGQARIWWQARLRVYHND